MAVIRFGPDGLEQAKVLQQHLPGARLQQDERAGSALVLLLGNGYTALLDVADLPPAPKVVKVPPEMVARPCT